MNHYRVTTCTRRADVSRSRLQFVPETIVAAKIFEALSEHGLISVTIHPISEAKFIAATRPNE